MMRIAPLVAMKSGFYFLALSSTSQDSWVAPIKIDMLYNAKLAEHRNEVDSRFRHLCVDSMLHPGELKPCSLLWWLKAQKGAFFRGLLRISKTDVQRGLMNETTPTITRLTGRYVELAIQVVGNLTSMAGPDIRDVELRKFFDEVHRGRITLCLLQIAIGGPHIAPAHLQDRPAMVDKILSLGYPVDFRACPWTFEPPEDLLWRYTPLEFLILNLGEVKLDERTRLRILQALLSAGAFPGWSYKAPFPFASTTMLTYCIQFETVGFVRLLLHHGADFNQRDDSCWLPVDYALLRQDRLISATLAEYQTEPIRPDYVPRQDALTRYEKEEGRGRGQLRSRS